MDDRDEWQDWVREVRASGMIWLYIYVNECVCMYVSVLVWETVACFRCSAIFTINPMHPV